MSQENRRSQENKRSQEAKGFQDAEGPDAPNGSHPALAPRGRRLLATLVDMVLVPLAAVFLVLVTGATEDAEDYINIPGMALHILALAVLAYLLLNGYGLLKQGQTIGKKLFGIAIANAKTNKPAAFWRLVCVRALFFPTLFLLLLLPSATLMSLSWFAALFPIVDQLFIFSKSRRTLHDRVSGTTVITNAKRNSA